MCGRLLSLSKNNVIIDTHLKSVLRHTPRPYLMPVSTFFPDLSNAQILEIPVGDQCVSVTRSCCGRYIAAGTDHRIVVADAMTGDILKSLNCHADVVRCLRFIRDGSEIVSGSHDGTIVVWEWQSSDLPRHILTGHSDWITGISVTSDGKQIISTSHDRTLRIWSRITGFKIGELIQTSQVVCLAFSPDERWVALGLYNGTLKVTDIFSEAVVFLDTEAHEDAVSCVEFSPDGSCLAAASHYLVRLWKTQTWKRVGVDLEDIPTG